MDLYSAFNGDPINFVDPTGRTSINYGAPQGPNGISFDEASWGLTQHFGGLPAFTLFPGDPSYEALESARFKDIGVTTTLEGEPAYTGITIAGSAVLGAALATEITVASGMSMTMSTTVAEHVGMPIIAAGVGAGLLGKATFDAAGTIAVTSYAWTQTTAGLATFNTALNMGAVSLFTAGYLSDQSGFNIDTGGLSGVNFGSYQSFADATISLIDLGANTSSVGTMLGDGIVTLWDTIYSKSSSSVSFGDYLDYSKDPFGWYLQSQHVEQDPTGKYVKP